MYKVNISRDLENPDWMHFFKVQKEDMSEEKRSPYLFIQLNTSGSKTPTHLDINHDHSTDYKLIILTVPCTVLCYDLKTL